MKRLLKRFWNALKAPPEYAVCSCYRCDGSKSPTRGMIRHGNYWYCCEAAYQEFMGELQQY